MSSSIFIFGNTSTETVSEASSTGESIDEKSNHIQQLKWTGNWYFAKNKTANTTFSYTKCLNSIVSQELLDYVSFTNEPDNGPVTKKRKNKWYRGRRKEKESPTAAVLSKTGKNNQPESKDYEDNLIEEEDEDDDDGREMSSSSVFSSEVVTSDSNATESLTKDSTPLLSEQIVMTNDNDNNNNNSESAFSFKDEDIKNNSHDDNNNNSQNTNNNQKVVTSPQKRSNSLEVESSTTNIINIEKTISSGVLIPNRHPLFGVWEGYFTLPGKTASHAGQGERLDEEYVRETFFFYAFDGEQYRTISFENDNSESNHTDEGVSIPGLENLPHPPRWTALYIRELYNDDNKNSEQQQQQEMKSVLSSSPSAQQGSVEDRISAIVSSSASSTDSPTVARVTATDIDVSSKTIKKEVSFEDLEILNEIVQVESKNIFNSVERGDEVSSVNDLVEIKFEAHTACHGDTNTESSDTVETFTAVDQSREVCTDISTFSSTSSSLLSTAAPNPLSSSATTPSRPRVTASPSEEEREREEDREVEEGAAAFTVDRDTCHTDQSSVPPRFYQQQPTPTSSLLIPPPEEIMLVGFGRNVFGRFSLAGAYNPRTGSLRCERKYMVTKFVAPARLMRPVNITSGAKVVNALSAPSQDSESASISNSDNLLIGGKRPVRQKRPYSVDTESYEHDSSSLLHSASTSTTSGKRKRSSSWLQQNQNINGNDGADNNGTSIDDDNNPWLAGTEGGSGKRGRKKGSGSNNVVTQTMSCEQFLESTKITAETLGYREACLDPHTGEVYEGEWLHGQRNGFGICLFADGTMYEGEWLKDKEEGKGVWMTGAREVLYSGDWSEGRMHGMGTYYFPSGDVYNGEFKEGFRHGSGQYQRADGSSYDGDWRDNLRHGRGIFLWTDGSQYNGDWEFGQRSGRGELTLSNKLTYSGSFAGNLMDGRGVLTFPDGQVYKGIFKNGLRDGRGSLEFPEGATYEGRFKEDLLDGQGTVKISQAVPGGVEGEIFIPLENLADIRRIHYKSGFGGDSHH